MSWSGRRWRGWWRRTGRTATWSAAPCSTPTSALSSGRCCTRPGAISTLYLRYIYILSPTIYRSGLVPLLPGGCLVPDGAADSANNRNTRGLGPNMRRRQSLPIGQHTPELVCSYISNCEIFYFCFFITFNKEQHRIALKLCETVVCVSHTHSCQFNPNHSSQCPVKKL